MEWRQLLYRYIVTVLNLLFQRLDAVIARDSHNDDFFYYAYHSSGLVVLYMTSSVFSIMAQMLQACFIMYVVGNVDTMQTKRIIVWKTVFLNFCCSLQFIYIVNTKSLAPQSNVIVIKVPRASTPLVLFSTQHRWLQYNDVLIYLGTLILNALTKLNTQPVLWKHKN